MGFTMQVSIISVFASSGPGTSQVPICMGCARGHTDASQPRKLEQPGKGESAVKEWDLCVETLG